jgi:hypothetical protein
MDLKKICKGLATLIYDLKVPKKKVFAATKYNIPRKKAFSLKRKERLMAL